MGMSIIHNMLAMNADRMLNLTGRYKAKSTEKLSSGYRINRAADDAAGLAISEKMRRQIRGLSQGVQNAQEGIGLCQVADGALNEVHDMLHRITELSVKAANGTNTESDREAIQQEVAQLLTEIDRISDTTTYNEQPIFQGTDIFMYDEDGNLMLESDIPFADFTIADLDLGQSPFSAHAPADRLRLQAVVNNEDSLANGRKYNLVFGDGSTSSSSIRLHYTYDGQDFVTEVPFSDLSPENYNAGTGTDGRPFWTRDFVYQNDDGVGIKITQKIMADDSGSTEKKYSVSYAFENTGTVDCSMDFMFHVDTAYNNDDRCEGYYTNGQRIERSCIYSSPGSDFVAGQTNSNLIDGIPDSFSIVDVDSALSFSEKVAFTKGKPDSLSIGYYHDICNWDYYDSLDDHLGRNMVRNDLGFSMMWKFDMTAGNTQEVEFDYGIAATKQDANLLGVPLQMSKAPLVDHEGIHSIWIHSGAEAGVGQWIELAEMNTEVLGIKYLDVSTVSGAETAMTAVKSALNSVSKLRSNVGAQQNRLEHTVDNENNIVENTTAAESRLRDADIAEEMVGFSNANILEQAGASMVAQANQQPNYILQLLR